MQQKINTIKRCNTMLSAIDTKYSNKRYVIGFPKPVLARIVLSVIDPNPVLMLYPRGKYENIAFDVNRTLMESGFSTGIKNIIINNDVQLIIPKIINGSTLDEMNDGMFHISPIDMTEFMMYPFDKNIGIVVANQVVFENKFEMVIESFLVQPLV